MDLWEAIVVAFRRWYVTLPVLLVGLVVALQLAQSVDPVHEAEATVQYLRPAVSTGDQETAIALAANPYSSEPRRLAFATELSALSEDFAVDLRERGFDADFEVVTDRREPVLYLTTRSTSPRSALDTLDALLEFVQQEAVDRQEVQFGGDPSLFVTADVLREDASTAIDRTSQTRARVLLLAVAGVMAMSAAVLAELVLSRWRKTDEPPVANDPEVVWFGVPLQGGQPPSMPPPSQPSLPPQQPHLTPAPDIEDQAEDDDPADEAQLGRTPRWSR